MQAQLGTSPQKDGQYKLCPLLCPVPHPWAPRIGACVDVALRGLCCTVHAHTSGSGLAPVILNTDIWAQRT